jgi:hypothetical protein
MGFLRKLFGAAKPQLSVVPDRHQLSSRTTERRRCFVYVSVRNSTQASESWRNELGEFHEVWARPVYIGRDPACTVVLPASEVAPVAVRVAAASHHRLLYRLPPETTLPLPLGSFPVGPADEIVDSRDFQVGPYTIRFSEVYRDGLSTAKQL